MTIERSYHAMFAEATPMLAAVRVVGGQIKINLFSEKNTTDDEIEKEVNFSIQKGSATIKELLIGCSDAYSEGETLTVTLAETEGSISEEISTQSITIPTLTANEFERVSVTDNANANAIKVTGTVTIPAGASFMIYAVLTDETGSIAEKVNEIANKLEVTEVRTLTDTDVEITLENNVIFNCGGLTDLEIVLPASTTADFTCQVNFTSGATPDETSVTAPNTIVWLGDDIESDVFIPAANKRYSVMFYYDGVNFRGITQGV